MNYTLWQSPLTPDEVAAGACLLAEPAVGDNAFHWLQSLPAEGGRCTVMHCIAGEAPYALVPDGYSVRSRVNEYGGGAWRLAGDGIVFVNDTNQALMHAAPGGVGTRFHEPGLALGDLEYDPARDSVYAVAEEQSAGGCQGIVRIDRDGSFQWVVRGADFYAAPRVSPGGAHLVWLEWSEPRMPWDGTRLMRAELDAAGGSSGEAAQIAGGPQESLAQPEWSPAGMLHVASDRPNGFWNLHRVSAAGLEPVRRVRAECARPAFVFAQRLYALDPEGGWLLAEAANGLWRCLVSPDGGEPERVLPEITDVVGVAAGREGEMVIGGGPADALTVFVRRRGETRFHPVARSLELALDPDFVSHPRPINFATPDGSEGHALYFPPAHPDHKPEGPVPVRVRCHGGPTSAASSALDPKTLYWTSRGFGMVHLNYCGSTGYGREYREALYGQWGVADVADARALAEALVTQGIAEAGRLVIAGGSAGGLTVLGTLAGESAYAAGASFYGVADLTSLTETTMRFEAHYGEQLVGPWPADRKVYEARSPINHADRITAPVIFFQGLDDPVVPPEQSKRMAGLLAGQGVPVVLETFAGERHGFREARTIARTLAAELAFYCRVLELETPEALPALDWRNAPG